jgi:hypothetical protein
LAFAPLAVALSRNSASIVRWTTLTEIVPAAPQVSLPWPSEPVTATISPVPLAVSVRPLR